MDELIYYRYELSSHSGGINISVNSFKIKVLFLTLIQCNMVGLFVKTYGRISKSSFLCYGLCLRSGGCFPDD